MLCPLTQCLMVRELFALARVAQQDRKIPGFRAQQWYFFFVAAFWMYIRQAYEGFAIPARDVPAGGWGNL